MATLPVAAGAKGQPPIPASEASIAVTPERTAAITFATAVLRVLWKCARSVPRRPDLAHDGDPLLDVARHRDADRVGEDDLVRVDRRDLPSPPRVRVSSGTSPSNGQPKAAEIVTVTRIPSAAARARILDTTSTASATDMPWLRRLKVSVVITTVFTSRIPAARARS